jgi:hypothetical protein
LTWSVPGWWRSSLNLWPTKRLRPPSQRFNRSIGSYDRLMRTRRAIVVAKEAQGPDQALNTLGNLGNVG